MIALFFLSCNEGLKNTKKYNYPITTKMDSTNIYFEKAIDDPYFWLEDVSSANTKDWIIKQNEYSDKILNESGNRGKIKKEIRALRSYDSYNMPQRYGDNIYYFVANVKHKQKILYKENVITGEIETFFDPNIIFKNKSIYLQNVSFSSNGLFVALVVSRGGSDWSNIMVYDVSNKKFLPDTIKNVKFSNISWYEDSFYYTGYGIENEDDKFSETSSKNQNIYLHKLGTTQLSDQIIFKSKNPGELYKIYIDRESKFIFVCGGISPSQSSSIYYKKINNNNFEVLFKNDSNSYVSMVNSNNQHLFFLTNYKAPNKRVVSIDLNSKELSEIIPENTHALTYTTYAHNKFFCHYIKDVKSHVKQFDSAGKFESVLELPGMGTVDGFKNINDKNELFFSYKSFTHPLTIYVYNVKEKKFKVFKKLKLNFNQDDYVVKQDFITSFDSTKIPIFIIHHKDIKLNSNNPTILTAYGSHGISYVPRFTSAFIYWIKNNGILVIANVRGGGEYGEKWHKDGKYLNKLNSIKDFIWAGKYLVNKKFTSKEKLISFGESNGGMLVAAALSMDNFCKTGIVGAANTDMLKYHKFTIGHFWKTEYGTADESKAVFEYLNSYSPYHNTEVLKNKALFVYTGEFDDRVFPAHSYKYIAKLQSNEDNFALLKTYKSGHYLHINKEINLNRTADTYSFIWYIIGGK